MFSNNITTGKSPSGTHTLNCNQVSTHVTRGESSAVLCERVLTFPCSCSSVTNCLPGPPKVPGTPPVCTLVEHCSENCFWHPASGGADPLGHFLRGKCAARGASGGTLRVDPEASLRGWDAFCAPRSTDASLCPPQPHLGFHLVGKRHAQ